MNTEVLWGGGLWWGLWAGAPLLKQVHQIMKRVKGIEPSTFSLGSCGPEFEGTATSTVTDDAATTMRSACPKSRPDGTKSGHDSQFVAALSMLAELPLPDEVKVAALRKIMRV